MIAFPGKKKRMNIDISSIKDILTDLTFLLEAETGTSVDKAKVWL